MEKGALYVVATPIGNLEDITYRAVRVLEEVDMIACEDTRVAKKLLFHYNIQKPLLASHQHSASASQKKILAHLLDGKTIALITDAGTPGISDPGGQLVALAVSEGIQAIPIPGPSALGALVSVAGIDMQRFVFMGFPPHKKGRQTFFREVVSSKRPVLYYESPHRLIKNLELLHEMNEKARLVIGKELTKLHEEIFRGRVEEVLNFFHENPDKIRGEFVVIVTEEK